MNSQTLVPILEYEAARLITGYSIPYPAFRFVTSLEKALDAAHEIGYPVVIKVVSQDILHKSEAGGVITGIANDSGLRKAYSTLRTSLRMRAPNSCIQGTLVCKQAPDGLEAMVGVKQDPAFGPIVLFGLGGIFTEALNDTTLRVAPFDREVAREMIREIRAYPLLAGARGRNAIDEEALVELLESVSRLACEHPEIVEMDLNPVRLFPEGLMVLDARVIVTE
jgi:acyl-CoA synthetase (NDP forming)